MLVNSSEIILHYLIQSHFLIVHLESKYMYNPALIKIRGPLGAIAV